MDPIEKDELLKVEPQIDELLNESLQEKAQDDFLGDTIKMVKLDSTNVHAQKDAYIDEMTGTVEPEEFEETYEVGPKLVRARRGSTLISILISTITIALGIIIAIIMVK